MAVVVEASSVREPVEVPAQTDASSEPAMVMVTVWVVVSLAAKAWVSVTESPASSASVALLEMA